jgi:hypothetical protein
MDVVTHRITTYFKLPKGETGLTQVGSKRVDTVDAMKWILAHAPEGAVTVDGHVITIDLDRMKEP